MTHYNYSCTSKSGFRVLGEVDYNEKKFDREELMRIVMKRVAYTVYGYNAPWDPFNVELIVSAQKEPGL